MKLDLQGRFQSTLNATVDADGKLRSGTGRPAGGNPALTLGAQRLFAFQFAAARLGQRLDSNVPILVSAQMNPLACDANSATLGSAGADHYQRNFAGAAVPNVWHPGGLADSQAGEDVSPGDVDINAQFNSSIGGACAFPRVWYYGVDANAGPNAIDYQVVLHELIHGVGFGTIVDLATGAKAMGFDDVYMRFLEDHSTGELYPDMTDGERVAASTDTGDLHWTGSDVVEDASDELNAGLDVATGHVEMYDPNPQEPGSSVSHFERTAAPNQLMEPVREADVGHEVGLAQELLEDIGWGLVRTPDFLTSVFHMLGFYE